MYLLNNFSTVVDTAVKFSDVAGYTHRYMYIHVPLIYMDIHVHVDLHVHVYITMYICARLI